MRHETQSSCRPLLFPTNQVERSRVRVGCRPAGVACRAPPTIETRLGRYSGKPAERSQLDTVCGRCNYRPNGTSCNGGNGTSPLDRFPRSQNVRDETTCAEFTWRADSTSVDRVASLDRPTRTPHHPSGNLWRQSELRRDPPRSSWKGTIQTSDPVVSYATKLVSTCSSLLFSS